jgi:hypothetical protein
VSEKIKACDAAGCWYEVVSGNIYQAGDAEPVLFTETPVRDEDELRSIVETYRIGLLHGEQRGRLAQAAEMRRALGIAASPAQEERGE